MTLEERSSVLSVLGCLRKGIIINKGLNLQLS